MIVFISNVSAYFGDKDHTSSAVIFFSYFWEKNNKFHLDNCRGSTETPLLIKAWLKTAQR